jgi:hypothetical protein
MRYARPANARESGMPLPLRRLHTSTAMVPLVKADGMIRKVGRST